jgi:hypothetical protein
MRKDIDDDTQGYLSDYPKREWVGLNWDEIPEIYMDDKAFEHGARWAEAKLKERNI